MLCAHGNITQLRRVAQRALFPRLEIVCLRAASVQEPASPSEIDSPRSCTKMSVESLRIESWRRLHTWEAQRQQQPSRTLTQEWCRAWLRAAWRSIVNACCTGRFFLLPPEGTCGYGSIAVGFAAVLGHVDIVRFLVVEVGCCVPELWEAVWKHELAEYNEAHDSSFSHRFALAGSFHAGMAAAWQRGALDVSTTGAAASPPPLVMYPARFVCARYLLVCVATCMHHVPPAATCVPLSCSFTGTRLSVQELTCR